MLLKAFMTGRSRSLVAGRDTFQVVTGPETPHIQSLILRSHTSGRLKFGGFARSPDHHNAFTCSLKLLLPTLLADLLSFRGGQCVQSELDAFFARLGTNGAGVLDTNCTLAKVRSELHVSALWLFRDRLVDTV